MTTPTDETTDTPYSPSSKPSLAARMKAYESTQNHTLPTTTPTTTPIVLRLDGHAFSRFTKGFARPFDQRIHSAMILCCTDLLHFFPRATVAYTQSDEITLIFPHGVQSHNERVQKLCSLAASNCSVRFNAHLKTCFENMPDPVVSDAAYEKIGTAYFDARFFSVPSVEEALGNLVWRCRNDAVRNAVSAFARTLYTAGELHGKSTGSVLKMMEDEKGVVFEEAVPRWAVEGCLVKRERVEHEGVNGKTGKVEKTIRTRTRVEEWGPREFREENLRLITEKHWWR